jgi:hypothetical protein
VGKSETFSSVLLALERAGVLSQIVLVGSWCLDVYRQQFGNPVTIPVTRTLDADLLLPRRLSRTLNLKVKILYFWNVRIDEVASGRYLFLKRGDTSLPFPKER